jgi:hypothetical protein
MATELINSNIYSYCVFATEFINDDVIAGECHVLSTSDEFNLDIHNVKIPDMINKINLGYLFNKSLLNVIWPYNLHTLIFGESFNQDILYVSWLSCPNLSVMKFGRDFNKDIYAVTWPILLHTLDMHDSFDRNISLLVIPSLKNFKLGYGFSQDISNVKWHEFILLYSLDLGTAGGDISNVIWPMSLTVLTLGFNYVADVSKADFKNVQIIRDYSSRITYESNKFNKTLKYIIHYEYVDYMDIYKSNIIYKRPTGMYTKGAIH